MGLVCRFKCTSVKRGENYEEIILNAVYTTNKNSPNYYWWSASPSGEFKMLINNPKAFGHIVPGQEYEIMISSAPELPPDDSSQA